MNLVSEVLLREDVRIADRLLSLLQVVVGPSPLDSVHYAKLERVRGGLQGDGRGCPEEHWGKTLMLYNNRPRGRGQRKRVRANGPGNAKSSRELHPYL